MDVAADRELHPVVEIGIVKADERQVARHDDIATACKLIQPHSDLIIEAHHCGAGLQQLVQIVAVRAVVEIVDALRRVPSHARFIQRQTAAAQSGGIADKAQMRRVVVRLENTTDVTVSALMQILNRTLRRPHIVRTDARQIPPRKFAVQQDTRQALFNLAVQIAVALENGIAARLEQQTVRRIVQNLAQNAPFILPAVVCDIQIGRVSRVHQRRADARDNRRKNILVLRGDDQSNRLGVCAAAQPLHRPDIGAASLYAVDHSLFFQQSDRLTHGLTAHTVLLPQLWLGFQPVARRERPVQNLLLQFMKQLHVLQHLFPLPLSWYVCFFVSFSAFIIR